MPVHNELTSSAIARIDTQGMIDLVRSFPDQVKKGRSIAEDVALDIDVRGKRQVVVIGMGGSAISGDLVRCYGVDQAPVPMQVVRNYALPASVDADTVVVASSFSGNTEETLAGFEAARARNATVVCIASGGALLDHAKRNGLPYAQIPGGMPPRAALGYSLSVLLVLSRKMGLIDVPDEAWAETDERLRAQTAAYEAPEGGHLAMEIAQRFAGQIPVIYSATGLMEAVNVRWRGQLQENAKKFAAGNVFPELNHNEIMGWETTPGFSPNGDLGVVVLRDREDHPRIQHRIDVTRSLLESRAASWTEVESAGEHRLTRMMSLINLGDWMSLHTAYLRGVDPTPIGLIDKLKDALSNV